MYKCNYCNNENEELYTISVEIAGESVECLQCSICKSVILKKEDVKAINERYCDIVDKNEALQDEVDNFNRTIKGHNIEISNEDVSAYIDSNTEPIFEYPR